MESLAKPQLRYKVDVNAVENHLTGAAIITDDFCIVIVEGGERLESCRHTVQMALVLVVAIDAVVAVAAAWGGTGSFPTNDR